MDTAAPPRLSGPTPGSPDPMPGTHTRRGASWWRARWCGLVLGVLTDGVSTVHPDGRVTPLASRPRLPAGPLVVVANHGSHADSAALLATLGRDRPVMFAAAADYWHASWPRRWAATVLMGVWPVRRDGHGWSDLAAAQDAVRRGGVLVVYPEGGRSRDGRLGDFHTGPFRLAARAGARVLPVALVGTDRVLPVHGRYARGPIEARWGTPIPVEEPATAADAAHRQIADRLTDDPGPLQPRPGRVWSRNTALASSRAGLSLVFAAAAAEAVSWPLTGDVAAGGTRTAHLAFGIVWLAWAPAHLVLVHDDALPVVLAVAVCDVTSWAGGRALGRLPVLSLRFTPVSPNKTVAGLVGGAAGAGLLLVALGGWTPALWLTVALGAPLGDLVASLFKRQARVKDAGRCLPGFGGVLDRVDSLLVVLPLVAVLP